MQNIHHLTGPSLVARCHRPSPPPALLLCQLVVAPAPLPSVADRRSTMSGEAWLYLLAVLINAVNLFLQVFFTIMYSDLEWYVFLKTHPCSCRTALLCAHAYASLDSDYINPIDLCNRLNTYIVPEAAVHAVLTALFVVNGYWVAILLNLPLVAWNAKKWVPNPLASPLTVQDLREPAPPRRDRDLPQAERAQEGKPLGARWRR